MSFRVGSGAPGGLAHRPPFSLRCWAACIVPCIERLTASGSADRVPGPAAGPRGQLSQLRRARAAVIAFFAVLGVSNGDWLARIPAIKHALHLSDGLLGIALLATPLGLAAVVLAARRIIERAGSALPTLAGGIAVALLPVAVGLAPNLPLLMSSLFALGIAGGLLDVAMNSQAVHVERGYGRPLMTSFHACYSFGGLAGSLLGGAFAWAGISPAVNFLAVGLPLAAASPVAGRWLLADPAGDGAGDDRAAAGERGASEPGASEPGASEPGASEPGASGRRAGSERRAGSHDGEGQKDSHRRRWTRPVLLLGLLALCSLLGEGSADGWSAVYLHDSLGTSAGFAALGYAAFSVAMAAGRLAGDRLAARFGPAALVRAGGLLAAAGLTAALIGASPVAAVIGFAVFGAGLSCTFPQLLSAAGKADPDQPAGPIARVAGFGYLGMLAGPVVIGGLASALGLPLALGLPVILALLIAVGAGQVVPRRPLSRRPLSRPLPPR